MAGLGKMTAVCNRGTRGGMGFQRLFYWSDAWKGGSEKYGFSSEAELRHGVRGDHGIRKSEQGGVVGNGVGKRLSK